MKTGTVSRPRNHTTLTAPYEASFTVTVMVFVTSAVLGSEPLATRMTLYVPATPVLVTVNDAGMMLLTTTLAVSSEYAS